MWRRVGRICAAKHPEELVLLRSTEMKWGHTEADYPAVLFNRLREKLGALPGVSWVMASDGALLAGGMEIDTVNCEGYHPSKDEDINPWVNLGKPGRAEFFLHARHSIGAGRDSAKRTRFLVLRWPSSANRRLRNTLPAATPSASI